MWTSVRTTTEAASRSVSTPWGATNVSAPTVSSWVTTSIPASTVLMVGLTTHNIFVQWCQSIMCLEVSNFLGGRWWKLIGADCSTQENWFNVWKALNSEQKIFLWFMLAAVQVPLLFLDFEVSISWSKSAHEVSSEGPLQGEHPHNSYQWGPPPPLGAAPQPLPHFLPDFPTNVNIYTKDYNILITIWSQYLIIIQYNRMFWTFESSQKTDSIGKF